MCSPIASKIHASGHWYRLDGTATTQPAGLPNACRGPSALLPHDSCIGGLALWLVGLM